MPPHEARGLHQHDHDYIYISLGPADVVNADREKPEVHLQLKDRETHFTRGGFAHVARNLGDAPFRNVSIALLKPQAEVRNGVRRLRSMLDEQAPDKRSVEKGQGFSVEPQMETPETSLDLICRRRGSAGNAARGPE